ncbi:MAG TPA: SIS domain-containing protein [Candidatus Paceibacterota bacterium]
MEESLKKFPEQFLFDPEIVNAAQLAPSYARYTIVGMGGSALAADLLRAVDPALPIFMHRSYDLPPHAEDGLVIASSYSGNTEETIDALKIAHSKGLPLCVIADSGALLELAREYKVPYIDLPQGGIQPRAALGYSFRAFSKILQLAGILEESKKLSESLESLQLKEAGKSIAAEIGSRVPIIYTSTARAPIGYIWKIALNETGKTPAFANVFPELNHNELEGMKTRADEFSRVFHFLFLRGHSDHPRIQKRMDLTEEMYRALNYQVTRVPAVEGPRLHEIFSSVLLGLWTANFTAVNMNVDPEQVLLVEEFKRKLAS